MSIVYYMEIGKEFVWLVELRSTAEFPGLMVFWLATSIRVAVLSDLLGRVHLSFLKRVDQFLVIQGRVKMFKAMTLGNMQTM